MEIAEIEKKVFRQLLSNPEVLVQYSTKISPEDFTTPIIRNVMNAFTSNVSAMAHYVPSKSYFEILMRDRYHSPAELDQVANVLSGIASVPVTTKDMDMHIRELKANRMCREMAQAIQKAVPIIRPDTVSEAYETLLKDLLRLPLSSSPSVQVAKMREIHDALEERVLELDAPMAARVSTGLKAFDAVMGGFGISELVTLTAGPGQGKSNLLLWWAAHMVECGKNIVYVTIEMSYEETMNRLNAIQTGYDVKEIALKKIHQDSRSDYFERLIAANKDPLVRDAFLRECAVIKDRANPTGALTLSRKYKNRESKMFIIDLPSGCTPARVEQEIQRLSMDNKIDCAFVDFINVMEPSFHHKNEVKELGNIARELKIIARKNHLLMFTAAQLKTGDKRDKDMQNQKLTTDDIKYATAIAEHSDWVVAFYRTEEDDLKKQVRLQMAKHRHSADVTALLEFDFANLQAVDLGFADGSLIPHGYLPNGEQTEAYLTRPAPQEDSEPAVDPLLGVDDGFDSAPVAIGAPSVTGATGTATHATGPTADPLSVIKEVFKVRSVKEVEPFEEEPFA